MNAIDHVGFMFDMIRQDHLRITPLVWGLDSLCREMIDNNFSRYQKLLARLEDHIKITTLATQRESELHEQHVGYLTSLLHAKAEVLFWCELSCLYYGSDPNAISTTRVLTEKRKLIERDKNRRQCGKDNNKHRKSRSTIKSKNSHKHGPNYSQLLQRHKGRCKSISKIK